MSRANLWLRHLTKRRPHKRRVWIEQPDILKRLALRSHAIVDQLYEGAVGQLEDEEKRDAVLTAKATTLLGISGLSLTVAFTFGGLLLQSPERLSGLGRIGGDGVVIAFGLSLLFGLGGSFMALRGLKVKHFEHVNEESIFDTDVLKDADTDWEKAWATSPVAADRAALSLYRRFLTAHIWGIYQRNFERLERKAETIKWAQRLYFTFVLALMVIGVAIATSAFFRIDGVAGH